MCAHVMFAKKTFINGLRYAKFFSLESFPLYKLCCTQLTYTVHVYVQVVIPHSHALNVLELVVKFGTMSWLPNTSLLYMYMYV